MRDVIDDQRKTLSELRKKLQSVGFANAETLVPQRGNPVTFPMGRINVFNWKSQIVISNLPESTVRMGFRKRPFVFTEHGVNMLASV